MTNRIITHEIVIGIFRLDITPYTPYGSALTIWANGRCIVQQLYDVGQDELAIKEYAIKYMQDILDSAEYDLTQYGGMVGEDE